MSGSISSASTALSLLQSITGSSSTTDLMTIINGGGQTSTTDPVAALLLAEKNQTQEIAAQAKEPQTAAEIKQFLAVVNKATSLKDILNDPIARKVFLTANGLGDQVDYTALVTKALLSDPTDPESLVNKLSNQSYLATAQTYDFAKSGLSVLKKSTVLASITNGYAQVQWEHSMDQQVPGLSAALDFRSRASTITNVDQILGDRNFRTVVTGALGIPQQIAFQPLQTQEKAITSRLDITKFKDPKFVEQFARQFLLVSNPNSSSGSSSSTSLFA